MPSAPLPADPAQHALAPSKLSAVGSFLTGGLLFALAGAVGLGGWHAQVAALRWPALGVAAALAGLAALVLRHGAAVWAGPTLLLWSDGRLAVRGLVRWRVWQPDQLAGWKLRRTARHVYVPFLFPKGWFTGLTLGERTMASDHRAIVHAWIRQHFPKL